MSRTTPLPRSFQPRRLGAGAAITVALGLLIAVVLPAGAADAAAYRYWGYYQLSGDSWQFATKGPEQTDPADGSVEGWRFAVGTEEVTRFPRATATFEEICGDTEVETGSKRVAVVIDYGRAADTADNTEPPAPVGECAVVAEAATGLEVLSKVADVRSDKGLICGIDDFPATGCGEEVKTVSAAAAAPDTAVELEPAEETTAKTASDDGDDSDAGTYIGVGVAILAALAVGLIALRRRGSA